MPRRRLRNVDKAVLDYSGLRIKTHDLVGGRLVAGDAMAAVGDQLLDQLGARPYLSRAVVISPVMSF